MTASRFGHLSLLAAAAVLCSAVPVASALAQTAEPGGRAAKMQAELQKRFAAADANGDGQLTRDEAKGKMPMVFKHYDEIDAAHHGFVTMADIQAYAIAQHAARQSAK